MSLLIATTAAAADTAAAAGWQLYNRWDLVAISVAVHVGILGLFLAGSAMPRRRLMSRPNGMLAAFMVALYAEMYGLPLTVYLVQPLLPGSLTLGSYPPPAGLRFLGSALILAGFFLVFLGWRAVHRSEGRLVREGLYAHIRHPQYVGLTLLTVGQLVQWPTLAGLVLWPLVVLLYRRLARMEEADLLAEHGAAAAAYMREVPGFLPWLGGRRACLPNGIPTSRAGKESTRP